MYISDIRIHIHMTTVYCINYKYKISEVRHAIPEIDVLWVGMHSESVRCFNNLKVLKALRGDLKTIETFGLSRSTHVTESCTWRTSSAISAQRRSRSASISKSIQYSYLDLYIYIYIYKHSMYIYICTYIYVLYDLWIPNIWNSTCNIWDWRTVNGNAQQGHPALQRSQGTQRTSRRPVKDRDLRIVTLNALHGILYMKDVFGDLCTAAI